MAAQSKTLHKPESCIYFRLTGVAIFAVKIFKSPLWLIYSHRFTWRNDGKKNDEDLVMIRLL